MCLTCTQEVMGTAGRSRGSCGEGKGSEVERRPVLGAVVSM